jgi:photosystem II stability/assembly factor-like uncharacterized protein
MDIVGLEQNIEEMIRRIQHLLAVLAGIATLTVLASAATETASDWKISGPFGGTATSIAVDPSNPKVILAGAMDSLLFKSSDAGATWSLLDFPKRHLSELTSILIDPCDSNHYLVGVIAADGGGLFESHDGGKQWSVLKGIRDFGVRSLAYAPSQPMRFAAGTLHGVMVSDDAGQTWKRISDPENYEMQGITVVAFDSKDPNILYAGTSHLPWKTIDGGKTWTPIHNGMIDDSDVFSIYVDPINPSNILASACSGIYSSSDRGDLWHKLLGIPNASRRTHVIRQDSSDPSIIYAGTTTGLYKSMNHGSTWRTLTDTQANFMAFDPTNARVLYMALEYEGIGKSEDGGEHIYPANNGFVDRVISAVTTSGKKMIAIETQEAESTGIFVSYDRGESWMQLRKTRGLSGVHLKAIAGLQDDDRTVLGASPHQMYKSIDAGITWKAIPVRLVIKPPEVPVTPSPSSSRSTRSTQRGRSPVHAKVRRPLAPKPIIRELSLSEVSSLYSIKIAEKDVFFAATDLGLLKSLDMGEHWTLADIPNSAAVTAIYFGPAESTSIIARAASGLYSSDDAEEHWKQISFPLSVADVNDVAIPAGEGKPLLVATRLGVYSSRDGGKKWFPLRNGLPISTVSSVLYNENEQTAFAVQYGRLYQSKDAGESWVEISSALPSTRIRQLWKSDSAPSRIYALTGELGIIYRD